MTEIIKISLAVSVMALGYIVTKQAIEITRLKNKVDWLIQEFFIVKGKIAEGRHGKKHKHRHNSGKQEESS